eukprot:255892-Amphidinium_carterae.1
MSCKKESCMRSHHGCESFLADAYSECAEVTPRWASVLGIVLSSCCCCWFCSQGFLQKEPGFVERTKYRQELEGSNAAGLASLDLTGTYTELGDTIATFYNLTISSSGTVSGTSKDDDGTAEVTGTLSWPDREKDSGIMTLLEWRGEDE